jgi:serine/threonine-protein kinase
MSDGPHSESGLPKVGDVIAGKFKVERMLGRGGMGAVFAAHHEFLNQRVALKLVLGSIAESKEARDRFMNEARAAFGIQSEHIARVLDVGEDQGRPFMVLEYLEGADLARIVEERGPLPVVEAVDYVVQALDAIGQAHAKGIIHRDLKPANLFIVRGSDGQGIVKVLDFGISKMTNPLAPDSGGMTSTKAMLGSPYYMSPEQLRSSRTVDARTDIWAIGIILHELLTGEVPYKGDNLGELFANILEQDAPPIGAKRPDVPPELQHVVLRCLQRKADHRYANVWELARDLVRFASPRAGAPFERLKQVAPNLPKPAMAASAMGGLAPLPNVAPQQTIPANTPPRHPSGHPQATMPHHATTPFNQLQQPPPNAPIPANTPSGPMMMPQGMVQQPGMHPGMTGGGWGGQTGSDINLVPAPPRSGGMKLVAAIALPIFFVLGIVVVFVVARGRKTTAEVPPVASSVAASSATAAATATETATSTATPASAGTAATAVTATASASADPQDGATVTAKTAALPTGRPAGTATGSIGRPTSTGATGVTTPATVAVTAAATTPHTAPTKPTASASGGFDPFSGRH